MAKLPLKILALDDDSEILDSLVRGLAKFNIQVIQARKLSEALTKLGNQEFSALLVDLMLEGSSGLKVIEVLRNPSNVAHINAATPIIVLSGHIDASAIKFVIGKVQAIVTKPFSIDSLAAKIGEVASKTVDPPPQPQPMPGESLSPIETLIHDVAGEVSAMDLFIGGLREDLTAAGKIDFGHAELERIERRINAIIAALERFRSGKGPT